MYEELKTTIAQNVRVRRKAQGLSLQALAEKSNVSIATISAIENERANNIGIRVLDALAGALGINLPTIITPIIADGVYKDSIKEFNEEDCVNILRDSSIKKTYYPPMLCEHEISSMLELALILPLLDLNELYDVYYRIMGSGIRYEDYISKLFEKLWKKVPDSPAKRYIQNELDAIHSIRNGEEISAVADRDCEAEDFIALQESLLQKQESARLLHLFILQQKLYND